MADDGGLPATDEYEAPRMENKRKFDETVGNDEPQVVASYNNGSNGDGGEQAGVGAAAVATYNNVPPPLSEFELAKQKAEQIAARLVGSEVKRPRTEENLDEINGSARSNGSDVDQGYTDHNHNHSREQEQAPEDHQHQQHQHHQEFQHGGSQQYHQGPQFYNQGGSNQSRKIDVPNSKVGLVIGKGGETIKYLQHQSGARIQVARDGESDPRSSTRQVELMGTPEQISRAEQLVKDVIAEQASAGGAGPVVGRGFGGPGGPPGEQVQVKVPNNKVGLIIGRGGETIKNLQSRSGARIQVQNDSETEPGATERMVTLIGNKKATDMAYDLIKEVIDEATTQRKSGTGGKLLHRIVSQGDLLAATISNRVVGTDLPVPHSSGVAHLLLPHLMVISRLLSIQGHHSSINKGPHKPMGSILSSQLLVMPLDGTSDHLLLLHSPSSRLPMIIMVSKDSRCNKPLRLQLLLQMLLVTVTVNRDITKGTHSNHKPQHMGIRLLHMVSRVIHSRAMLNQLIVDMHMLSLQQVMHKRTASKVMVPMDRLSLDMPLLLQMELHQLLLVAMITIQPLLPLLPLLLLASLQQHQQHKAK